jgi:hypothetical protein
MPQGVVEGLEAVQVQKQQGPMQTTAGVGHHRLLDTVHQKAPHEQGLPDGRVIQVTERATPDGGLVITYHDVTELRQASAEIENLAFYDPLTGRWPFLAGSERSCGACVDLLVEEFLPNTTAGT